MARPFLEADQALPLIAKAKSAKSWSGWSCRSNHVSHIIGVAELLDADGISIPGLTVELEAKAAIVADTCLYIFSIMKLRGRERVPVYQLEVASRAKRTHNGLTTIYGPHEHIGSTEPTPITEASVDCSSWEACLQWFISRTNIVNLTPDNPFKKP